jgi:hypothetical protein
MKMKLISVLSFCVVLMIAFVSCSGSQSNSGKQDEVKRDPMHFKDVLWEDGDYSWLEKAELTSEGDTFEVAVIAEERRNSYDETGIGDRCSSSYYGEAWTTSVSSEVYSETKESTKEEAYEKMETWMLEFITTGGGSMENGEVLEVTQQDVDGGFITTGVCYYETMDYGGNTPHIFVDSKVYRSGTLLRNTANTPISETDLKKELLRYFKIAHLEDEINSLAERLETA